jgi:CBS domain-containing protein/sporulation protein YlmC with PRC-barrel domain
MELTRLHKREVVDRDGRRLGVIADLGVRLTASHPLVSHVVVRLPTRETRVILWDQVRRLDEDRLELATTDGGRDVVVPDDVLLLYRDVLDCQVFDAVGKRLARVADVRLADDAGRLRVMGVEVGVGAVLRRLGFARTGRRWREDPIDWADVHLASARGHTLMLHSATVRRLTPLQLAELLGHLPADRGADLLTALPSQVAADVMSRARPRLGARLMRTIAPHRVAPIVGSMARDDAAAALRHLSASELDTVLGQVESTRATQLRALVAHRATTAGGLMNPDVLTLPIGTTVEDARTYVASHPPALDALLTVFTVDDEGRPVGAITPTDLLTGRPVPAAPPPTVRQSDPVALVVDTFALNDVLALAVTNDDGRLVGAIAVDDVFEELLAERLPGRRRYRHIRGRRL